MSTASVASGRGEGRSERTGTFTTGIVSRMEGHDIVLFYNVMIPKSLPLLVGEIPQYR